MRTIWKYTLVLGGSAKFRMPKGAKVLCAQEQFQQFCIWAVVDTSQPGEEREFILLGTGNPIMVPDANLKYVDTMQTQDGHFVGHLFEVLP